VSDRHRGLTPAGVSPKDTEPADRSGFAAGVADAAAALRTLFKPTPLQRSDFLSSRHGAEVWLKREDLTPVRSYKIGGAFNAMRKALAARPDRRHFVCASAGNHAQGLAYAATSAPRARSSCR
jgi:threonine dehydratase